MRKMGRDVEKRREFCCVSRRTVAGGKSDRVIFEDMYSGFWTAEVEERSGKG
jgi:hypothetical protein